MTQVMRTRGWVTVQRLLAFLAFVVFILAAFGVGAGWPVQLVPFGLAILAAALVL